MTNLTAGLTPEEAAQKLKQYGYNELADRKKKWFHLLIGELRDFMVIILFIAGTVALIQGDNLDAAVIGFTLLINIVMGFFQQYKTEQAISALKSKTALMARVTRDEMVLEVPAREIVPGDLVHLEAGDQVPADGLLVEAAGLKIDESTLTGESVPVDKDNAGDNSRVQAGTVVTSGRGRMLVEATGMNTELGRIAGLIQEAAPVTPLQLRLARLGKLLALAALIICVLVFVLGILRGEPRDVMLLTAITLAVAVVPESLPTVVTVVLAMGAQVMYGHKALIRRLSAVETLGCVSYICSDKTGTLTQNRMQVDAVLIAAREASLLYLDMVLCNDAHLYARNEKQGIGDPTDLALLEFAAGQGFLAEKLHLQYPRLAEVPFDSKRKRMSTLCRYDEKMMLFVKGAADGILELSHWHHPERGVFYRQEAERLAARGYRVIALACRRWKGNPAELGEEDEKDLTFLGLTALIDPLREEAGKAVETCHGAGVRTVMITGDHPLTALAIARKLDIADMDSHVVTGAELNLMPADELAEVIDEARVYARVTPEHKMRIVGALQRKGHIVAMTGDGVNDGPALKKADIGVAMGQSGTDVSRQAADMVLLDDNFNTIVHAVELGRTLYDNIRKFICYMLTANFSEVIVMLLALAFNLPVPFVPIQVLWINIVAEGLPAFALSREPGERDVMEQPPRNPKETVFARGVGTHILWVGILIGLLTLGVLWFFRHDPSWRTMVFLTMVFCQLAHILAIRSTRHSVFTIGLLKNPLLLLTVAFFILVQVAFVYWAPLQGIFGTVALTWPRFLLCAGLAGLVFAAVETEKFFYRRRKLYFRGVGDEWGIF